MAALVFILAYLFMPGDVGNSQVVTMVRSCVGLCVCNIPCHLVWKACVER